MEQSVIKIKNCLMKPYRGRYDIRVGIFPTDQQTNASEENIDVGFIQGSEKERLYFLGLLLFFS